MPQLLQNASLVSMSPPRLDRRDLLIDGAVIAPPGSEADSKALDLSGRIVIPGNVCAHTHVYSALARGMPGPPRAPRDFLEILELIWWRLDRALDEQSIRYSGLVAAMDAIRAGTTTLVDHHASPNSLDGSLDLLADAFSRVGVRGVLCYEVTDRNGVEGRTAGLRENERFIRANRRPLRTPVLPWRMRR
jgi:cytosine/adenosine deaminase-related metal-dependent hydrolase